MFYCEIRELSFCVWILKIRPEKNHYRRLKGLNNAHFWSDLQNPSFRETVEENLLIFQI